MAATSRCHVPRLLTWSEAAASCAVPEVLTTSARDCALGGNPHFGGNEFLAATIADFGFWNRAFTAEAVAKLASPP